MCKALHVNMKEIEGVLLTKKSCPEENQNDVEVVVRCQFIIPGDELKF